MNKSLLRLFLLFVAGAAAGSWAAVIDNGSLEHLNAKNEPNNWYFIQAECPGAKVEVSSVAASGERSLSISNPQTRQPNVYCGFGTNIQVQPGTEYTVRFMAKGAPGAKGFALAIGNLWEVRLPIGPLTETWSEYRMTFQLPASAIGGNGYAAFALLSEDIASSAWFDDFRFDGEVPGGTGKQGSRELTAQPIEFAFIPRATVPNGRFEDRIGERAAGWTFKWANSPDSQIDVIKTESGNALRFIHPQSRGGNVYCAAITRVRLLPAIRYRLTFKARGTDVLWCNIGVGEGWSRRFQVTPLSEAWNDFAFEFSLPPGQVGADGNAPLVIVVEDKAGEVQLADFEIAEAETPITPLSAEEFRTGDRLEPDHPNLLGKNATNQAQIGLWNDCWQLRIESRNRNRFVLHLPDTEETVRIAGEPGTVQTVPLPKKLGGIFRFALFEEDALEEETIPAPTDFRWICRIGAEYAAYVLTDAEPGKFIQGLLLYSGNIVPAGTGLTLEVGPVLTVPLGRTETAGGQIPFFVNLEGLEPGSCQGRILAGTKPLAVFDIRKPDLAAENRTALNRLAEEVADLKTQFVRRNREWTRNGHLSSRMFVLEKMVADLRTLEAKSSAPEAINYFNERCELALRQCAALLDELAALLKAEAPPPPTITGIEGNFTLRNHWPEAGLVYSDGTRKRAPLFLNGYGHFEDAVQALDRFGALGVNSIQIEIGPAYVLAGQNSDGSFQVDPQYLESFVLPALQRAAANGVTVNLLLSPHYLPGWYQARNPEIGSPSGWLLEYEVNHPKAREMMAAFLEAVLPRLAAAAGRGALCGITVSNEPIYFGFQPEKPFAKALFQKELQTRFGEVEALNRELGKTFASWEDAIAAVSGDPGMKFLFFSFKRRMFAMWHRWMAERVKAFLPEVPVSAKLMAGRALTTQFASDGVDLDLLDECFDQSGQDNGMSRIAPGGESYAADYLHALFANEYQYSRSGKSVSNTENHVVPDHSRAPQSGAFVYTANLQQYLSGASNLITWVWKEKPEHGLGYNISFRPDCLVAQAEAAFAANANYEAFRAFSDFSPEIAIYYSEASQLLNPESYQKVYELYAAAAGSGHRVSFVSDRQLAGRRFAHLKTILIAGQSHAPEESVEALRRFIGNGGTVVMTPESLQFNQYGVTRDVGLNGARVDELAGAEDFARAIEGRHRVEFPLQTTDGNPGHMFYRAVPSLVYLVNFNHLTKRVRLSGDSGQRFKDLLSGRIYPAEFNLPSLTPLLLTPDSP